MLNQLMLSLKERVAMVLASLSIDCVKDHRQRTSVALCILLLAFFGCCALSATPAFADTEGTNTYRIKYYCSFSSEEGEEDRFDEGGSIQIRKLTSNEPPLNE